MYDVGIVGCGVIGNRLAGSFEEHDGTTVRAACDLDDERLAAFAEEYGAAETYTDYADLVESGVDVVYVGVPPALHREVTEAALEAGTHVICEKPIAEDAAEGAAMVEAAERAREDGQVTAVNLPFRYTAGFVEMRKRIQDGDVGEPRRVNLEFRFPRWPREWQDVAWLEGREQGGPMREVGTHFLFGVHEIFGPIDRVSARVRYSGPDRYEESVVGHFTAGDGDREVDGTIDLVTDADCEERNDITVLGTDGALTLTDWYRLLAGESGEAHDSETSVLNETRESTTLQLVEEFVTELDGGDGDLVSFAEATAVQRVLDAVFDSEGELVTGVQAD